jgi:hypothetical protein
MSMSFITFGALTVFKGLVLEGLSKIRTKEKLLKDS